MDEFSVSAEKFIQKSLAGMNLQSLDQAPPEVRKSLLREARQIVRNDVFGHGYKTDKNNRPQEQGRGSAQQPTRQSVEAYRKYGVKEPEYAAHLSRMEKELAAFEAQRAKERAAMGEDF
jgi:hypothetical protein